MSAADIEEIQAQAVKLAQLYGVAGSLKSDMVMVPVEEPPIVKAKTLTFTYHASDTTTSDWLFGPETETPKPNIPLRPPAPPAETTKDHERLKIPLGKIRIGDNHYPRPVVEDAVRILRSAAGNAVRIPLRKARNPIADADLRLVHKIESAWRPASAKGAACLRNTVLRHLEDALTGQRGPFTRRPDGTCERIVPTYEPGIIRDYPQDAAQEVIKYFPDSRVLLPHRRTMPNSAIKDWVDAWYAGNLSGAYQIEQNHLPEGAALHPAHPGAPYNVDTHYVEWPLVVDGELPAGTLPPGNWPSPHSPAWSIGLAANYLVAASAKNTVMMTAGQHIAWAKAHVLGNRLTVDLLSGRAKHRADQGAWFRTNTLVHQSEHDYVDTQTWREQVAAAIPVVNWSTGNLAAFYHDNNLPMPRFWDQQVARILGIIDGIRRRMLDEARKLTFTLDPDQPKLGGYHQKILLRDQHDNRWIFKPAPTPHAQFRPEVEHEAHVLARAWGYRTADSRLITHDGTYGQAQAMLPIERTLIGVHGEAFAELTPRQLVAIAAEHVLDWALDNDDCHGHNIGLTTDGDAIGIDKGRTWRYFGSWKGLYPDERANSNASLVYTALYEAIAAGHIPEDTVDLMYRAAISRARIIQRYPDKDLRASVHRAVAHRPHYRPSSYQTPIDGAPTNADELADQVVARKNHITDDITLLWQRIYAAAGRTPPHFPGGALGLNPQGHPIHAGLDTPEFHEAIGLTRNYGTPTFIAGEHIEDAHILCWRERTLAGATHIRGAFKIRTDTTAHQNLQLWCDKVRRRKTNPFTITITPTTRARSSVTAAVYDDDGELLLDGGAVTATECEGHPLDGDMYLIEMDTGEEIEIRRHNANISYQGQVQFTIKDPNQLAASLTRIRALLEGASCPLEPATARDLELFYWRHLAAVMDDRCDSNRDVFTERYAAFWRAVPKDPKNAPDEIGMWRNAFGILTTPETVTAFITQGDHLPQFQHFDMRRPEQPNGRPYWNRIDITDDELRHFKHLGLVYRTGPINALRFGGSLSTEARIRHLGFFKPGLSSAHDCSVGSGDFVFTRLGATQPGYSILFNPRILRRTTTYCFVGDKYGRLALRRSESYFGANQIRGIEECGNEAMIKGMIAILDDAEFLFFYNEGQRDEALEYLRSVGLTHIRGLAIEDRLLVRIDDPDELHRVIAAKKALLDAYTQSS